MCPDMHREGGGGHINLVTVRAAPLGVVAGVLVGLSMPGEVAGAAVVFSTVMAGVLGRWGGCLAN